MSTYFSFTCLWAGWSLADLAELCWAWLWSAGWFQVCSKSLSFCWYPRASRGHDLPLAMNGRAQMGWVEIHHAQGPGLEGTRCSFCPRSTGWKQVTCQPSSTPMRWEAHAISGGGTTESRGKGYWSQEAWAMGTNDAIGHRNVWNVWCAGAVPRVLYT